MQNSSFFFTMAIFISSVNFSTCSLFQIEVPLKRKSKKSFQTSEKLAVSVQREVSRRIVSRTKSRSLFPVWSLSSEMHCLCWHCIFENFQFSTLNSTQFSADFWTICNRRRHLVGNYYCIECEFVLKNCRFFILFHFSFSGMRK